jgi:poly-gamma-glutamate capsule biosynthesis protein CapA/YwtB (metallophosphatase superfamily)
MLGRGVGEALLRQAPESFVAPEVVAAAREADLFVLNLECCISDRGEPWPAPGKPFFFRAPPVAVDLLEHLGVDCVTLANNHALDYGEKALLDTFECLSAAGIRWAGAGRDLDEAQAPAMLEAPNSFRLAVFGLTDHPADYAAGQGLPGVAYADLWHEDVPPWLVEAIRGTDADAVLVTPHWGPNMRAEPVAHVRRAARQLLEAGATLVAGHSAHVFQGIRDRVLYDLGGFLDDYAVDATLRNDLGVLWLVELDASGPRRIEAVPLKLDYCFTRLAEAEDLLWLEARFRALGSILATPAEGVKMLVRPSVQRTS